MGAREAIGRQPLCRYVLRPPVASDRLAVAADGRVLVTFLGRLAVLVPRPRWGRGRCGGRLQLMALTEQAAVIIRILRHLGLPSEVPGSCPPRSPPTSAPPDTDAWTW
jgi:hypothetical protein